MPSISSKKGFMTFECWYCRDCSCQEEQQTMQITFKHLKYILRNIQNWARRYDENQFSICMRFLWSVSSVQNYANWSKEPKVLKCCVTRNAKKYNVVKSEKYHLNICVELPRTSIEARQAFVYAFVCECLFAFALRKTVQAKQKTK